MKSIFYTTFLIIKSILILSFSFQDYKVNESKFVIHKADPSQGKLKLYWKNDQSEIYGSLGKLKEEEPTLIFATNGGMYGSDQRPIGLFIEDGKTQRAINRVKEAHGNFYLQPNGVFYLTNNNKANIKQTSDFAVNESIKYATQSGPMLLINGKYHPALRKGSTNLHIRNGVGILPDGKVMFAMSKERVNFYDLATLFKQHGCVNALYLDGFVSRTYAPKSNWEQTDGKFGVIIGEVE